MKLHISVLLIFTFVNFVRLEILDDGATGQNSVAQRDELKQLSELVSPNEHTDEKRSHNLYRARAREEESDERDDYLSRERMPSFRPEMTFPKMFNILERPEPPESEEPERINPFLSSMTNIDATASRPLPMSISQEPPKFVFSSMHMKLMPKNEESREEGILNDLRSEIQGGRIGLPEMIQDAPNPSSLESELRRVNSQPSAVFQIIKSTPFNRPQELSEMDEVTIEEVTPEHSSLEDTTHPSIIRIPNKKPPISSDYANRFGAISSASISKKPMLKKSMKPSLKINKPTSEKPKSKKMNTTTKKSKKDSKDKPSCPSGGDFVNGTKELWNGFHKADSWSRSFGAVADSAKKATKSVGSCFKSMWRGITGFFGYGDDEDKEASKKESRKSRETPRNETTTPNPNSKNETTTSKPNSENETTTSNPNSTTKAPNQMRGLWTKTKNGFNEKISKPVTGFFNDLATKTKEVFERATNMDDEDINSEDDMKSDHQNL